MIASLYYILSGYSDWMWTYLLFEKSINFSQMNNPWKQSYKVEDPGMIDLKHAIQNHLCKKSKENDDMKYLL